MNGKHCLCAHSHFLAHCLFCIRFRDAARQFHSRGSKSEVHWSSIRPHRLSSHYGEFCKLFCCQTSRDLDFFSDSGTRSGEQLFNMIDNCTVFSKDKNCAVFSELFDVDPCKLGHLAQGLEQVRSAAVGRQSAKSKDPKSKDPKSKDPKSKDPKSKDPVDQGIRDIRNKLAHEPLSAEDYQFKLLVSCARKLLEGICIVAGCVIGEFDTHCARESLAEIERIEKRNLHIVPMSDSEHENLLRWEQELERENISLMNRNEFLGYVHSFTGASKFFLDIYFRFNFPPTPGHASLGKTLMRFWFWVFIFYAFLVIMLWFGIEACVIFAVESARNPYSPLSSPCPALNSSMMPPQYALTAAAGYHGRMFVRSLNVPDIAVENRCYPMSGGARGSFLWIGDKLVAFSEMNNNIYDCQRNLIYETCYDCDAELKVYDSDKTYIWSSGIPKIVFGSSEEQPFNQIVYGQPSNLPVAIVSKNLTISIYNFSHPASDPRLLITTFSRAYFLANPGMDSCNTNLWQKLIFSTIIGIVLLVKCMDRHFLIPRFIIKCRYIHAKLVHLIHICRSTRYNKEGILDG